MSGNRDVLLRQGWREAAHWWREQEPDLTFRELADMLGVTYKQVWRAFNVERCQETERNRRASKREWDNANYERTRKNPCACGQPKTKGADVCQECTDTTAVVRRSLVEGMWADGWVRGEINAVLGVASKSPYIFVMRSQHGWDLPHRRNGKALDNIRAGCVQGLETRRAA